MNEVNAFEDEFARQIARGLELAGEVERLEAEVERLRAAAVVKDWLIERYGGALERIAGTGQGEAETTNQAWDPRSIARAALAKEEA